MGAGGALAQQHSIHLLQEDLVKIVLLFEKQCRQILGNTNLICDIEKPKNLLTKQPCPCTARHLASSIHNQLFLLQAQGIYQEQAAGVTRLTLALKDAQQ